ncbi:MAG: alanine racemase [Gammaproteobacteria bacterium]|nr:MAG: alanine racemase [Gammaproteobacteria bacterium]
MPGPHSLTADAITPTVTEMKEYGGWLELSRSALLHNLAGVRRLVEPAQVMAVVKANAYGAGAVGMAGVLQDAGVARFAVATIDEAVALREAGIAGDILCLTYFDRSDAAAIRHHGLTATVFTESGVSILSALASGAGERLRVWLKVDTGLGRLGVPMERAAAFVDSILRDTPLDIRGIYSTLSESRDRDRQQLARLLALRQQVPAAVDATWSLASSHGILTLPESCLDVVRPGVMLLGFPPSEPERMDADRVAVADPRSVVTWKTRIAGIKTLPAGEQVGYGEQPPLARDSRVASLMVGWSDGYSGSPQQRSCVLIGERRCRVLALSANTTLVDVTPSESAKAGDEAVLLGRRNDVEIGVEELARAGGGVYRMLAGIPARVPRIWS